MCAQTKQENVAEVEMQNAANEHDWATNIGETRGGQAVAHRGRTLPPTRSRQACEVRPPSGDESFCFGGFLQGIKTLGSARHERFTVFKLENLMMFRVVVAHGEKGRGNFLR